MRTKCELNWAIVTIAFWAVCLCTATAGIVIHGEVEVLNVFNQVFIWEGVHYFVPVCSNFMKPEL